MVQFFTYLNHGYTHFWQVGPYWTMIRHDQPWSVMVNRGPWSTMVSIRLWQWSWSTMVWQWCQLPFTSSNGQPCPNHCQPSLTASNGLPWSYMSYHCWAMIFLAGVLVGRDIMGTRIVLKGPHGQLYSKSTKWKSQAVLGSGHQNYLSEVTFSDGWPLPSTDLFIWQLIWLPRWGQ